MTFLIILIASVLVLYVLGSSAAFRGGYHTGVYETLKKIRTLNDELDKPDVDINKVRHEYTKFLIECSVKNMKAPDFIDWLTSYFKKKR